MRDESVDDRVSAGGPARTGRRSYHRPQAPVVAGTVSGLTQNGWYMGASDGDAYSYPYG
jgi:hypothetical protein